MSGSKFIAWLTERPAREALLAATAVTALLATVYGGGHFWPPAKTLAGLLAPNLLLWLPIAAIVYSHRDLAAFGITGRDWKTGLAWGAGAALIVLPLFLLGYWLFWDVLGGRATAWRFDRGLLTRLPAQLIVVALPEEIFFRGYLQTLLGRAWPSRRLSWVGTEFWAIVAAAALFALAHLAADPRWFRLGVFFPGLLFGVLRARTGSVVAPIVLHTLANLTIYFLEGRI